MDKTAIQRQIDATDRPIDQLVYEACYPIARQVLYVSNLVGAMAAREPRLRATAL